MTTTDQVKALCQRAQLALTQRDLNTAAACCQQVLQRHKNNQDAIRMMAEICERSGRYDEAREYFKQLVTQFPKHAPYRMKLGQMYLNAGDVASAHRQMEKAYRIDPTMPAAIAGLSACYELEGTHEQARKLIERHQRTLPPHAGITALYLRLLNHAEEYEEAIRRGDAFLAAGRDTSGNPDEMRAVSFAVAEAYEKTHRYDEAFDYATKANRMNMPAFDPGKHAAEIDAMIKVFSPGLIRSAPRAHGATDVPVFIAGMPRSGSSLLEQIIQSHPEAHGAGELSHLEIQTVYMHVAIGSARPYPFCVPDLTQETTDAQSQLYLEKLIAHAPKARRITDKVLSLYRQCGLINLLFPQARIIHIRRKAVDVCLACYMARLVTKQIPFTSDLAHIGHVYRDYRRLMDHWRSALDIPMLEVDYEKLTRDQEAETRRILEFCDLPWNDACLQFHKARRVVATLSYDQVRRPMYTTSVGRAERFRKHLGPLIEVLGDYAKE
jgi:tetratricopeptide (TPR) repeat protein